MNRCTSPLLALLHKARPTLHAAALVTLTVATVSYVSPVVAQVPGSLGGVRTFPEQARRGTLSVLSTVEAQIDGTPVRMAPGMRLMSPQNSLIMLHMVIGKQYAVNYTIEKSTGMLHTAWILNKEELALPREGSGVKRNFRFESDADPR